MTLLQFYKLLVVLLAITFEKTYAMSISEPKKIQESHEIHSTNSNNCLQNGSSKCLIFKFLNYLTYDKTARISDDNRSLEEESLINQTYTQLENILLDKFLKSSESLVISNDVDKNSGPISKGKNYFEDLEPRIDLSAPISIMK